MFSKDFSPDDRKKLELAVKIVQSYFPYLGGIFTKLDIRYDDRIDTAAVTPFGKLLFNRIFLDNLAPGLETAFILAHELFHLAQGYFERAGHFKDLESLNIAHDILINELLCDTMNLPEPPCGGLSWKWFLEKVYEEWAWYDERFSHPIPGIPNPAEKASAYSLEQMVCIIMSVKDTRSHPGNEAWGDKRGGTARPDDVLTGNPFADAFDDGSPKEPDPPKISSGAITLDMLDEETEKKFFPDEDESERQQTRSELEEALHNSLLQKIILSSADGMIYGSDAGDIQRDVEMIKSTYLPPWEMAMQRWFDGVAAPKRSWGRPSRRGAWRNDVVFPGRSRDMMMLHIILDTSDSMTELIPIILGQISAFARNVGIREVHVIQCDVAIQLDEFIEIDQLERYKVSGYGGSDLSAAMLKLAEDPEVTSVLILTDGGINYPPEEKIPYDVLWCHPDIGSCPGIPYGKVIHVPIPEKGV